MTDIDPTLHPKHQGASTNPDTGIDALAWLTKRQIDTLLALGVNGVVAERARADVMAVLIRAMETINR